MMNTHFLGYINAILQCLFSTTWFTAYIQQGLDKPVHALLNRLLKAYREKREISSREIREKLAKLDKEFDFGKMGDGFSAVSLLFKILFKECGDESKETELGKIFLSYAVNKCNTHDEY